MEEKTKAYTVEELEAELKREQTRTRRRHRRHNLFRVLLARDEEAALALENRKAIARKLGEEAGTKLLVPMVMMLAVTLVMIMIPAYLGFSV